MKLLEFFENGKEPAKVDAVMQKVVSYLSRELGTNLIRIPGLEAYHNSLEKGYGIRYVLNGSTKAIRFNWQTEAAGKGNTMASIDVWEGHSHDPNYHITARGISLVKVLPLLAQHIRDPKIGTFKGFGRPIDEAKRGEWTPADALDDFINWMARAPGGLGKTDFVNKYHISNVGLYDSIAHDFKDKFEWLPRGRITVRPDVNYDKVKKMILATAHVEVQVAAGGSGEEYEGSDGLPEGERVSFNDSLEHLEGLVEGIVKGSFNALFVCGKGGTGKTQTVEDTLAKHGLEDGNGYFKNTGTASASGLYGLLYKYRKNILLFDDSDDALGDQTARNLIKAATDTKRIRKLVWSKKSSGMYDPDNEPEKTEDDVDSEDGEEPTIGDTRVPTHFNFEGRIIFISNLPLNKLDPDGALRTRAFVISINPTTEEILDKMSDILMKVKLEPGLSLSKKEREEVLDVIRKSKRRDHASLRTLVRGLNLAASGASNWRKLIELYA
jgi:hypothetical protein